MLTWGTNDAFPPCGNCQKRRPSYDVVYADRHLSYIWNSTTATSVRCYAVVVCKSCNQLSLIQYAQLNLKENKQRDVLDPIVINNYVKSSELHHFILRFDSTNLFLSVHPRPQNLINSYEGFPEEVVNSLISAKVLLNAKDIVHASAVIGSCRTALEIAIKTIRSNLQDIKLESHSSFCSIIKDLRKENIIPNGMLEWSDHVRITGNNAVHEGRASIEDATECFEFVELFCHIVFTLPALIKQKKIQK